MIPWTVDHAKEASRAWRYGCTNNQRPSEVSPGTITEMMISAVLEVPAEAADPEIGTVARNGHSMPLMPP